MDIIIEHNTAQVANAFAIAPEIMNRNLTQFLRRAANEVAREEKKNAPKSFSNLVNSISANKISDLHYRISTGVKYGFYMEHGTKPYFPNSTNLVPWIRQFFKLNEPQAKRLSFVIARSIARKGVHKHPYVEPTVKKMRPRVIELMNAGVQAGLNEAFGSIK